MLDLLLSFARPGSVERQNVDLADLAEKAVALRAFTLNRARIAVSVERAGGLPPVASINRGRILQVFLNLLLNAEAALANRPDAAVHVRVERSGQDCTVVFTDNGPGMSASGSALVSSAAAIHELGADVSGIGLWVSARIAEQHGGRLEIADASATGASLRLSLPAVP
jgi:two-component system sensor histidine kinase HupT/HoxJ